MYIRPLFTNTTSFSCCYLQLYPFNMFPSDYSYFHRPQSHLENSSTSYPLAVAILLHYYPSPLILAFSSYIKLPPTLSSYITRSLKLQFIFSILCFIQSRYHWNPPIPDPQTTSCSIHLCSTSFKIFQQPQLHPTTVKPRYTAPRFTQTPIYRGHFLPPNRTKHT